MITANNQSIIMCALKKAHEMRTNQASEILNAPGICNGILHLFHRKAIKKMKKNHQPFTLDIAKETAKEMSKIYHAILEGDQAPKRLDQLAFFQSPRRPQPKKSFCKDSKQLTIDNIAAINHSYNLQKYENGKNKNAFPSDQAVSCYLNFYDDFQITQDFGGCVEEIDLIRILSYYLPLHPNEIIRIPIPIHAIGMGYHIDSQGNQAISIFDPNYDIEDPLLVLEFTDLRQVLERLMRRLEESFYSDEFIPYPFNGCFTLSLKFYSFAPKPKVEEKDGVTFLMELLQEEEKNTEYPVKYNQKDKQGYNSLFVCAQYGHEAAVKMLLTRYPSLKPNKKQGIKYLASPLEVSQQQGHDNISRFLQKRYT